MCGEYRSDLGTTVEMTVPEFKTFLDGLNVSGVVFGLLNPCLSDTDNERAIEFIISFTSASVQLGSNLILLDTRRRTGYVCRFGSSVTLTGSDDNFLTFSNVYRVEVEPEDVGRYIISLFCVEYIGGRRKRQTYHLTLEGLPKE